MTPPSVTSSRDAILQAVRAALPSAVDRPVAREPAPARTSGELSLLDEFVSSATVAGAEVVLAERGDVARLARGALNESGFVLSTIADVRSTVSPETAVHDLASVDLFVCDSALGVAENGAVWLATSDVRRRAPLFLAARVVIVIPADAIVADLHDAYARIDVRAYAFGVFVSGPSKTADIEQSLVIGAHGPKELTLIVVDHQGGSATAR